MIPYEDIDVKKKSLGFLAAYQRHVNRKSQIVNRKFYSYPRWSLPAPATDSQPWRLVGLLLLVGLVIGLLVQVRPVFSSSAALVVPTITPAATPAAAAETAVDNPLAASPQTTGLSPVFTPEVQHWADKIVAWAAEFDLDPNLVATIMQVESCGDETAVSSAGAQGLFQVMPFHFAAGENPLDPDTNARRGLAYFRDRLTQTNGEIGRAFAGYNGGHVAADGSWDTWAAETRAYYRWTTGIYADIQAGLTASPTLQAWQNSGGGSYCQLVAAKLNGSIGED